MNTRSGATKNGLLRNCDFLRSVGTPRLKDRKLKQNTALYHINLKTRHAELLSQLNGI